ncbi:MAG: hypothetical protein ACM3X6_00655 [Patescibacteria group bacterium]
MKNMLICFLIFLIICIIGCNSRDVVIKDVERALFSEIHEVWLLKNEDQQRISLGSDKICILREVVRKGTKLVEISQNEFNDRYKKISMMIFGIVRNDMHTMNLFYDYQSNLMYVNKSQIHYKSYAKYIRDKKLTDKYLLGVYCFCVDDILRTICDDYD